MTEHIIQIKINTIDENQRKIIRVKATFDDNYSILYGTKFMDIWNNATHKKFGNTKSLVDISVAIEEQNVESMLTVRLLRLLDVDKLDIQMSSRLAQFYVYPSHVRYDKTTNSIIYFPSDSGWKSSVPVTDYMTKSERDYYKGLGYGIFCKVLSITPFFQENPNTNICLEASGGETDEDMKKLVRYYESMGFNPISDDPEFIDLSYDNGLLMYAKVSDITSICKIKARPVMIDNEY